MRVSDSCFLVLLLFLLIFCIFESDLQRAFWYSSGTLIDSILLVKYHRADRLDSMEKLPQINLEKEVSYDGIINVRAAFEHKSIIHTGRKLLIMKHGVRQEEVSKSNTSYNNHTKNKRSHQKTRNMKRLKKKGSHQYHQRHYYERGVGAFTEDYRVPRPHPPRNN